MKDGDWFTWLTLIIVLLALYNIKWLFSPNLIFGPGMIP
jgi:hypothetical protein